MAARMGMEKRFSLRKIRKQSERCTRKKLFFLGVLCSGVAYVFWYDALKVLPASKVGALLYLEPLVSLGVAAGVLGERITGGSLVGGAIILAGLWIVTRIR